MKNNQEEIFIVVNKQDRIIDYRTRYECHHNNKLIHRAIGIVIFNKMGQILMQKRSKNKDLYPNLYTISTSGHVDKGETYHQAAKRELQEELGINIPLKQERKFLSEIDVESEMDCLFTGTYEGPFFPNEEEVDEVKYVSTSQLKKMRSVLTPFAIASLEQLKLL